MKRRATFILDYRVLYEGSVFIFQFLDDKMHNYVKQNITVNFIIQKLKNKHLKQHEPNNF